MASSLPRLCVRPQIAVNPVSRALASGPKLGLATYEDKLAIDGEHVAQFITERSRAGQVTLPPIDDVLDTWITLFGVQLGHASLKRLPSIPPDDIRPVMDALAALGYAKPLGNAFIWTDRIGRAAEMLARQIVTRRHHEAGLSIPC
jgi:hypothetical protein